MKKHIRFLVSVLGAILLLAAAAVPVSATTAEQLPTLESTDKFTTAPAEGGVAITGYTGNSNSIVIPASLDGKTVVAVAERAFHGRTGLRSVTFACDTISIGDYAFAGCIALESLVIPSVSAIGVSAFEGCTALYRADLGGELVSISQKAFASCSSLTSLYLPATLKQVGESAFGSCPRLSVLVTDSTTVSLLTAFGGTTAVTVFAPAGSVAASSGGEYSFVVAMGGEAVTTAATTGGVAVTAVSASAKAVVIPEYINGSRVVAVAENAFADRKNLRAVILPDSVTSMGKQAFEGAVALRYVRFPVSGGLNLGKAAFKGCAALESAILPEGIDAIGIDCFYGCSSLYLVALPRSLAHIQAGAFYGCSALSALYFGGDVPECAYINGTAEVVAFGSAPDTMKIYAPAGLSWSSRWSANGSNYAAYSVVRRSTDCFYTENVLVPVSCGAAGVSEYVCLHCGDSFTAAYPQTEHNFVSVIVSGDTETFRCTGCTANYTVRRIQAAEVTATVDQTKREENMITSISVTFRGEELVRDVDYTCSVEYSRLLNRLEITVCGIGGYSGTVKAAYSSLTGNKLQSYTLTVVGASGSGSYFRDDSVELIPNEPVPEGMKAVWTASAGTLVTAKNDRAVIEMPASDVTVTLSLVTAPVTTPPETQPPVTTPPVTTPPETEPPVTVPPETIPPDDPADTAPPFGGSDEARGFVRRAVLLSAVLVLSLGGFIVVCIFMFKKDTGKK